MPRPTHVALALALLLAAASATHSGLAADKRRLLFLRQGAPAETALLEALRIQLAGTAELIELEAAADSAEARAAWRSTHAELELWIDPEEQAVHVARSSEPAQPIGVGPGPDNAETARVLALKISELLDTEPKAQAEPPAPRAPTTLAFVELRAGATRGGSPSFFLPSLSFASGPRFQSTRGLAEVYGLFALDADVRALSRIGEVDTSLAYFGIGGRALLRSDVFALGPYLELGVMVLRAQGIVDPKHRGGAELRAPLCQPGLEARVQVADRLELRAALGLELWLERERLELHDTAVLDFGRSRAAGSLSAVMPLF